MFQMPKKVVIIMYKGPKQHSDAAGWAWAWKQLGWRL